MGVGWSGCGEVGCFRHNILTPAVVICVRIYPTVYSIFLIFSFIFMVPTETKRASILKFALCYMYPPKGKRVLQI